MHAISSGIELLVSDRRLYPDEVVLLLLLVKELTVNLLDCEIKGKLIDNYCLF